MSWRSRQWHIRMGVCDHVTFVYVCPAVVFSMQLSYSRCSEMPLLRAPRLVFALQLASAVVCLVGSVVADHPLALSHATTPTQRYDEQIYLLHIITTIIIIYIYSIGVSFGNKAIIITFHFQQNHLFI